jgi:hypothetical protein
VEGSRWRGRLALCGARCVGCGDVTHFARAFEVFVAEIPGNAEGVKDVALGCLSTRATLFDCVNGTRRDSCLEGQLILRPA